MNQQIPIDKSPGPINDSAGIIAGWSTRPTACASRANALTVDVEDYFQVEAFAGLDDVIVEDSQRAEVLVGGVVVVAEGEVLAGVEPAEVLMVALF